MNDQEIDKITDDLVDLWHETRDIEGVELHQFLGMTQQEYSIWATRPSEVGARLHGYWRWLHSQLIPMHEVECPECETTVRARMADARDVARIIELEKQVADLQTKLTAARRQARVGIVAKQEAEHGRWAL
jgi:hypothetical protein